jgi:hypothetical protein
MISAMEPSHAPQPVIAGWHPSPTNTGDEQWWDGNQWTPATRPATIAATTEPSTGHRNRYILIGATVVAAIVAASIVVLLVGSRGGNSVERYGQNPVALAKRLKICPSPERAGESTVKCTFEDGTAAALTTLSSDTEQQFFVATVKDNNDNECLVVVKGFAVGAASRSALTRAVGVPEEFAAKHHGYLLNC